MNVIIVDPNLLLSLGNADNVEHTARTTVQSSVLPGFTSV